MNNEGPIRLRIIQTKPAAHLGPDIRGISSFGEVEPDPAVVKFVLGGFKQRLLGIFEFGELNKPVSFVFFVLAAARNQKERLDLAEPRQEHLDLIICAFAGLAGMSTS